MNRKPTPKDYITAAGTVLSGIIRAFALALYSRIKLWVKRNKGCCRCCIICKYFNECKNDFLIKEIITNDERKYFNGY